jgi:hypothetical protein
VTVSVSGDKDVDIVTIRLDGQQLTLSLDDDREAAFVLGTNRDVVSIEVFAGTDTYGEPIGTLDEFDLRDLKCDEDKEPVDDDAKAELSVECAATGIDNVYRVSVSVTGADLRFATVAFEGRDRRVLLDDEGQGSFLVRTDADEFSAAVYPGSDTDADPIGELDSFDLSSLDCSDRRSDAKVEISVECTDESDEGRYRVSVAVSGDNPPEEVTIAYTGEEETIDLDEDATGSIVVDARGAVLPVRVYAGDEAKGLPLGFDVIGLRDLDCDGKFSERRVPGDEYRDDDDDEYGDVDDDEYGDDDDDEDEERDD